LTASRKPEPRKGGAKVRFVLVEAEVEEGNLGEITHAIASALRVAPQRMMIGPAGANRANVSASGGTATAAPAMDVEPEAIPNDDSTIETEAAPQQAAPSKSRVKRDLPKPKIVPVEFGNGPDSLEEFVRAAGSPKGLRDRYLVIAAWFNEKRHVEAIDVNHVYTCFKQLGWADAVPNNVSDPFWKLHKIDLGKYAKNQFVINQIGLNEVAKMTSELVSA